MLRQRNIGSAVSVSNPSNWSVGRSATPHLSGATQATRQARGRQEPVLAEETQATMMMATSNLRRSARRASYKTRRLSCIAMRPWAELAAVCLSLILAACRQGEPASNAQVPKRAQPALRLVALTDVSGYLEPCGCQSKLFGGIDRA